MSVFEDVSTAATSRVGLSLEPLGVRVCRLEEYPTLNPEP